VKISQNCLEKKMAEPESTMESQLITEINEVHLQRLFKKITLALGRIFYLYPVPDEAVWDATRCLDNIFRDELGLPPKEVDDALPHNHSQGRKHPAVTGLLKRLDEYV
jgi:hypothetical protein